MRTFLHAMLYYWGLPIILGLGGLAGLKLLCLVFGFSPYQFASIPGGTYEVGNVIGDLDITDNPIRSVTLSAYSMAVTDVTKDQWDTVRMWALTKGYSDLPVGAGKAANHPVQMVDWYAVVKWANAASEKNDLTPCYTTSGAVYRTGSIDAVMCNWSANGYRLPTEVEWEVAARGGLTGKRFPWGDTISHNQANYHASSAYSYDLSGAVNNFHPTHAKGGTPFTSRGGSLPTANGYGLYDMAGNVWQWCWDWYGPPDSGSDPRGVASGSCRVLRGGDWRNVPDFARSARRYSYDPSFANFSYGFRLAKGPS